MTALGLGKPVFRGPVTSMQNAAALQCFARVRLYLVGQGLRGRVLFHPVSAGVKNDARHLVGASHALVINQWEYSLQSVTAIGCGLH